MQLIDYSHKYPAPVVLLVYSSLVRMVPVAVFVFRVVFAGCSKLAISGTGAKASLDYAILAA